MIAAEFQTTLVGAPLIIAEDKHMVDFVIARTERQQRILVVGKMRPGRVVADFSAQCERRTAA